MTLALVAAAAVGSAPVAAASARRVDVRVIGAPAGGRLPVAVSTGARGCRALRIATLAAGRGGPRFSSALRLGDRLRVRLGAGGGLRAVAVRRTRRSRAPSFARLDALIAGVRSAGASARSDLAAVAALPPDAAGQRNFASAEQARALRERLNLLDERVLALAAALDRGALAIDAAFGSAGRRCGALRRARSRRTRPLREGAAAARAASRALRGGSDEIDRLLTFIPPAGLELPIGTVGTLTKAIQDALDLISGLTGGARR